MKKLTYINISYHEANRKVWNWLIDKFKNLKSKNAVLGYLWLPLALVILGIVVILGWFACFTLLFKDVRFTPHYLRTAIKYNNLTTEQAVEYLETKKQRYLSSLAFGNISKKKKNTIDACFELLNKEYKLPEEDEQDTFINHLNDIKTTVIETHSKVQYISEYTHQTEQKEIAFEEEREMQNQKQQKANKAQKRLNSKSPENFESSLSDEQLDLLVECCNKIKVFNKTVIKTELEKTVKLTP